MKSKLSKTALILLVVMMTILVLVACGDNAKTFSVKIYDGDDLLAQIDAASGEPLQVEGKVTKPNAVLKGLYFDKEFTQEFTKDGIVSGEMTLYAKFETKTYTIVIRSNGGGEVAPVTVTKGGEYTLTAPVREGYEFLRYTYIDDNDDVQTFPLSGVYPFDYGIRLTAQWKEDFTVTLNDTVSAAPTVLAVKYGAKAIFPADPVKKGHTFIGWFAEGATTAFDKNAEIKADCVLTARFTANTYTITMVNYPGWSLSVNYGEQYTLPTKAEIEAAITGADKEWISFIGYECDEDGFDPAKLTDTYQWDKNIVITAKCEENEAYDTRTVTLVRETDGAAIDTLSVTKGDTVGDRLDAISTALDGYDFAGWFERSAQGAFSPFNPLTPINSAMTLYARYTAKHYTITIDYGDGTSEEVNAVYKGAYALPASPVKVGHNFVRYLLAGEEFAANGTFTWLEDLTVTIEWSQDTDTFIDAGTYFKERASAADEYTYVFLTGRTYDFGADSRISTEDGYDYVSIRSTGGTNNQFAASAVTPGDESFSLTITPAHGVAKTITARVVESVSVFGFGADYNGMISSVDKADLFMVTTTESDYVMDVGYENFKPDLSIKNYSGRAIDLAAANLKVTINGAERADMIDGNVLRLTEDMKGNTYSISFEPKYALAADNISVQTINVKVNGGVNVYNNQDMKNAYANSSVKQINVLRKIVAELSDSDYDLKFGGHGAKQETIKLYKDDSFNESEAVTLNVNTGTPINDFEHGVYVRSTNLRNDDIVINGNYFTIDGSKLPYIDNEHDRYGAGGSEYAQDGPYRLANTQLGIFLYRCVDEDENGGILRKYASGQAKMNNLRIESNYIPDYASYLQLFHGDKNEKPLLKMSCSYIGVVVRGGTMTMDNVAIEGAEMGFMLHGEVSGYDVPGVTADSARWIDDNENGVVDEGEVRVVPEKMPGETQACKLFFNNSKIDHSWANSIYAFDLCAITLTHSKIGVSCGAAISVDDRPYIKNGGSSSTVLNGYSELNTSLVMDNYTASNINNWVIGTEAWFAAYAMQPIATGAIQEMENAVSGNSMSVVKKSEKGESMMNFAILVRPVQKDASDWNADIDGGNPAITTQVIAPAALSSAAGYMAFFYSGEEEQATVGAELEEFAKASYFLQTYGSEEKAMQYYTDHPEEYAAHQDDLEGYFMSLLAENLDKATSNFNAASAFLATTKDTGVMGKMVLMIPTHFVNPLA